MADVEIELNNEDAANVERLSEEGNVFVDNDNFDAALKKFTAALNILPTPKINWEASLWLYASIGDMYLFKEEYELACANYYNALNCPDGQASAFVHLRLGETLYELEQEEKALDHLLRAYILEGKAIFEEEEDKYFKFLEDNVEL
jgi:tetratricopeptide (TPR) repeat protein